MSRQLAKQTTIQTPQEAKNQPINHTCMRAYLGLHERTYSRTRAWMHTIDMTHPVT